MRKPNWLKPKNYRRIGNQHRDAHQWVASAQAYKQHLELKPEDTPIWVQYGHSLKESGDLQGAEAAYRTAVERTPEDSDVHFHIGTVLKLQGQDIGAMAAYDTALRLGRTDGLEVEMRSAKARMAKTVRPLPQGMTVYSIQDMIGYLHAHSTFSGIQRVQAGIAKYLLDHAGADVGFVMTDTVGQLERGDFWLVRKEDFRTVIDFASGRDADHDELRILLSRCEFNAELVRAGSGTTVIILGAFWGLGNTPDSFLPAKRAGARIGVYIYDIIPLSHPEYCETELSFYFKVALGQICAIADFILTISDYTRFRMTALLEEVGVRAIPMATVALAHDMTGAIVQSEPRPKALDALAGRDFVAFVSTIEGRKNHLYVVEVWQKLIAEGISVPDLVFVGRKGWKVGPLNDVLKKTDNLGGRVHLIHDLTDAELTGVYQNCRFTVFTSFVEGWGLPVGESLLNGTPCVASNVSSMPEVGGAFVDYVDPTDISDGVTVIRRMVTDETYLAERRRNIVENFKPRNWDDVGANFVAKVEGFRRLNPLPVRAWPLAQGKLMRTRELLVGSPDLADLIGKPRGLLLAESFYPPETIGCWMRGNEGGITFQTPLDAGTPVTVYVRLVKAPGRDDAELTFTIGDVETAMLVGELPNVNEPDRVLRLPGRVGPGGQCRIELRIDAAAPSRGADARLFIVGLSAVGYAATDDVQARFALIEACMFEGPLA